METALTAWLDKIQRLHPSEIELGLARVSQVYRRLFKDKPAYKVLSVAGTNGKGSCAQLLSDIYQQAGYCVGKYSSPHLVRFNERFEISGQSASDEQLIAAFERVESVRGECDLTFFEFTTLAAFCLFEQLGVEVAVMEVGLGGRLDAVNVVDADGVLVSSISIDHTQWLGETLEEIGLEKIAIARAQKPCVLGMATLPLSVSDYAKQNQLSLAVLGQDFSYQRGEQEPSWCWSNNLGQCYLDLPLPFNQEGVQLDNAACVLALVDKLRGSLQVSEQAIREALRLSSLKGRCQIVDVQPLIILDVAHNQASVARLAEFVSRQLADKKCQGKVVAVCGMLKDKQIAQSVNEIAALIDQWHIASIDYERGSDALSLKKIIQSLPNVQDKASLFCYQNAVQAYQQARKLLNNQDCLLVFGSFFIVGDIIALCEQEPIDKLH